MKNAVETERPVQDLVVDHAALSLALTVDVYRLSAKIQKLFKTLDL